MTQLMDQKRAAVDAEIVTATRRSALAEMASRYQISQENLVNVIKKTCIKGNASDAEFQAFIVVANQYGLNPLTREIHAFASNGAIVPIVGIDGWSKIVNGQARFDGCEFEDIDNDGDIGITCIMYVKDRSRPIRLTEWLKECKRNTAPWNTMPRRMLRHKSFMQAARLAFSIGGIFDEDEARDIYAPDRAAETKPIDINERMKALPAAKPADPDAHDPAPEEPTIQQEAAPEEVQPPAPAPEPAKPAAEQPQAEEPMPLNCTADQVIRHAVYHCPEGMSPDDAKARFTAWLTLDNPKPWSRKNSAEKSKIWAAIIDGTCDCWNKAV